jgi:hypothetical protein
MMKYWLGFCLTAFPLALPAATSTFTSDEKAVFFLSRANKLMRLDLTDKQITEANLPAPIQPDKVVALGTSNSGALLILQGRDLLSCDPSQKHVSTLFSFNHKIKVNEKPEQWEPTDFTYNRADGSILLLANNGHYDQLFQLPKGQQNVRAIWQRRVSRITGLTYLSSGQLVFGSGGDLWCGMIGEDPDSPEETRHFLRAIRIAPLATLETDNATPSQQGVSVVAASTKLLYIHVERLGGSGWGSILTLRLPNPQIGQEPAETDSKDASDPMYLDLVARYQLYRDNLASVQSLGENGTDACLSTSRSGNKVFFRASQGQDEKEAYWLVEGDQPPRRLADCEAE